MLEWQVKTIKDLGKVVTGKTPSKENDEFYNDGELPFVSPKDLDWNSYYVYDTQTKVTDKAYESQKNQRVPTNSVFYTSLSFAIGKIGIASRESLTNQQIHSIVVNDKHHYKFVYYLLQQYRPYIFCFNSGIDTPIVPKSVFEKINVVVPDLDVQKKIAAILSAYDDLIENNKKRIQILGNMAEELYKEWFVRFRFPNWENTEFEKGVPKGWEIEKILNLVDRKKFGRVYKEFELASEGSIPVIDQSQKDILGFHEGEGEHKASFESPMIIFGDHSCKMQMMFKNFSLAENVIPFKSKGNISLLYLFSLIKDQVETTEYKRHWGELTSKKVLLAPIILQENYANLTIDKMKLIERLKTANNYLVSCRDQLLPRLISGKLSVEDLDIQFPLSMQDQ